MSTHRITIGLTVVVAALAGSVQAQTVVYVDENATGTPDGISWCTAYLEVYTALELATTGTTI